MSSPSKGSAYTRVNLYASTDGNKRTKIHASNTFAFPRTHLEASLSVTYQDLF